MVMPLRRHFATLQVASGSEEPQRRSGDEVALKVEGVVNRAMHAEEALGRIELT